MIFMWRGVTHISDACESLHEYRDVPGVVTGLMLLFEEMQSVLQRSQEKYSSIGMASTVGWPSVPSYRLKIEL